MLPTRGPVKTENSVLVSQVTQARNVVAYYSRVRIIINLLLAKLVLMALVGRQLTSCIPTGLVESKE